VLALYTHVHFASRPRLAAALVDAASRATGRVSAS
jgi:hypothetical protein